MCANLYPALRAAFIHTDELWRQQRRQLAWFEGECPLRAAGVSAARLPCFTSSRSSNTYGAGVPEGG